MQLHIQHGQQLTGRPGRTAPAPPTVSHSSSRQHLQPLLQQQQQQGLHVRQQQGHLSGQKKLWQQCVRKVAAAAAAGSELWTPEKDKALADAVSQLRELVEALPELPDEVQGALAMRVPGLLETPAAEVRSRLEQLAAALGLELVATGRLIGKVPLLWNRSPESAAAKLSSVADALGIDTTAAAALFIAVPSLASINMPGVVRDRVDALSDSLGVSCAKAALMIGRQPMLWVINRGDVRTNVPALAAALGLQQQQQQPLEQQQQQQQYDASTLVEKMPVLLACETKWLRCNVSEFVSRSGLARSVVIDLLAKYPSLSTVDAQAVLSGLEELSSVLEVSVEDALQLVMNQPTLMLAKPPAILGAMDVLSAALKLSRPADALKILVSCPALLYDITLPALAARLEQLSVVMACSPEEAREAALQQPVLLVVPASALQTALASAAQQLGRPSQELLQLLLSDPGALLSMGYMGGPSGAAETWAARLAMDPEAVSALVAAQPSLLELSPNTLRARLESLAALFDVPAAAAAQLLLKHPALAAIPPNVTITRTKQLSMALRCSMARAGELIAKVPSLLLLPVSSLGPGSLAGTPVDTVLDMCATYEWYTSQWLMAAAKDRQPQKMTSFSAMHS